MTAGATFTHSYTYDEGDNIIGETLPSGRDVTITRDAVRRMASISADVNSASTTLLSAMTYRGDNQLLTATFGNGAVKVNGDTHIFYPTNPFRTDRQNDSP